jgi:hypothetical protein
MTMTPISDRIYPVLAIALLSLTGCAGGGMGTLGNVLGGVLGGGGAGGAQQGEVLVEVQGVDTQQQAIQVRTEQGETGAVLFDQNTVVVYREQQYPVTALERGDVAVMQLQQVDQNRLYTPRVDVRQSVQERTGQTSSGGGQLLQASGRVGQIDHQRNSFELQTQQGIYTVFLPQNAGAGTLEYFHRLQTGSNVSVEGTPTGADGITLRRFL